MLLKKVIINLNLGKKKQKTNKKRIEDKDSVGVSRGWLANGWQWFTDNVVNFFRQKMAGSFLLIVCSTIMNHYSGFQLAQLVKSMMVV